MRLNTTTEKVTLNKQSHAFHPAENEEVSIFDSSARTYSGENGIINRKQLPDEELVRSFLKDQNEEAFNEIVSRYADKIFRLVLRITKNRTDAEDVLQEVFLAMEKLHTFREESKFSTWLYRVATNAGYGHNRAKKKKFNKEVCLEDYVSYNGYGVLKGVQIKDWNDRPEEVLLSREGMEIIERAVHDLPASHSVVFHLRDLEGLTNAEVAEVLGVSVNAVKSRIHRARLFLRDRLSDYFYEWRK